MARVNVSNYVPRRPKNLVSTAKGDTLAHRPPCSHIVYVPGIFWLPPVDVGQLDRPALLADLRNMPVADVGP